MENFKECIGKILLNKSGNEIGTITNIVNHSGIECFEIGSIKQGTRSGRYWQTERLNSERSDRISVK